MSIEKSEENMERKNLSFTEEYQKGIRRRRCKATLFVLLILLEVFAGLVFLKWISENNLHHRVIWQFENQHKGAISFSTGTYIGNTDFGYFTENGTFNFTSGTVYTGQWDNTSMHGLGVLKIPNEGTYEGSFAESQKSGNGIFRWDDSASYEGEWKNDQMCGQGTYISSDGVKYTGIFGGNQFREGVCEFSNTTGTYCAYYKDYSIENLNVVFPDGTTYNGDSDGKTLNGAGNIIFANGDQYTGKFDNGLRNGQGVYIWKNGDKYDGAWSKDAMSGSGKYTYSNGSYAQGEFNNNQFIKGLYNIVTDFGNYTFKIENKEIVSVNMSLTSGTKYSGEMKDGKLTGTAQITYSNGDKYSGRVVDGYKSGQGSYTWSSGASYDGDWKDDKMHGQGTYLYSGKETGYKLTGTFENGRPNGECRYYVTSYESYKTDWENGKCVKVYE